MIFYFTGTGNSLAAATQIAADTKEELIDIASTVKSRRFSYSLEENERLGFVFPVYFGGIPNILSWFIDRLQLSGTPSFTYVVLTCGGSPIAADQMIKKALAEKGIYTDAVYKLKMPDNYVILYDVATEEAADQTLSEAAPLLDSILISILTRGEDKRGADPYESGTKELLLTKSMYPLYEKGRKTEKFWVDDRCVGCGACASRCACGAIEMTEGRPVWVKERCIHCLGCINRCGAIQYGKKTPERNRYKHPVFRKKKDCH